MCERKFCDKQNLTFIGIWIKFAEKACCRDFTTGQLACEFYEKNALNEGLDRSFNCIYDLLMEKDGGVCVIQAQAQDYDILSSAVFTGDM